MPEEKGKAVERGRNITNEERQQTIDNAEFLLKRVVNLSPELREKGYEALNFMKRELEIRKSKSNCPHCRNLISENARFCSKCGNKID